MALKKPSELFYKKETSSVLGTPEVSSHITESYDKFRNNFDKVNELSEKVKILSQELSEKITKSELESAMLSQLMVLDENFKSLQNEVKGLNKRDLKDFKEGVYNITEIVDNLIKNELPNYKRQITKNELYVGEQVKQLQGRVKENISNIREEIDTKFDNIVEVIDNNINYFNQQLQETSSQVKKTSETYNNLSKILENKVLKENETLEEYSQIIENLSDLFEGLAISLKDEYSNFSQLTEEKFEQLSTVLKEELSDISQINEEKIESISFSLDNRLDDYRKELVDVKADVVINDEHIKKVDKYLKEHHQELEDLKEQVFAEIKNLPVGNLQENLERLEKKIDFIKETYSKIEPEVIVKEVIQESNFTEPPQTKNSDPLTPLNQNFVTLDQLQQHYRLFINRIQQQISTLGGGGETQFRYLDDIVGIATNSNYYNGGVLVWNSSTNTAEFTTNIGIGTTGLLSNETLDTVTDRGNTTTNGIGVSFVNLPVGSVISGDSEIIANITNANLNVVLEHGDYANIGIGSYGLTYGITGIPYAVYELKLVPSPTLQINDIIGGAAIPIGSKIIGIGTGSYNKVIITDKNFPVGGVLPVENTIITFARPIVNAGLSIATIENTDITLNSGSGGNIVAHSDILPYANNIWSLGSPGKRFKEIWFGTGTIYVQDETLGNDQALGAKDGNFYIQGGAGLEVGEWILRDNEIRIKNPSRDVYFGSLGATADVVFNRSIKIQDSTNRTAYYTDRTGRTQYYPPTIPAGDIGGVSIIGSTNGAYQPVVNAGGMLHITGNDGAVSRITNDGFGTGAFPAYISRAGRGTAASPSAIQLGDILSRYSTVGFGSTAFPTGPAASNIEVYAKENFTNTKQGTEYRIYTAPLGTTTKTLDLTIDNYGLSFVGTSSSTGITFYDNSRLTYFPPQTAGTANKFLKVSNVGGNYVMSWETPPTIEGAVIYKGLYNVETNNPPITDASGQAGWEYTVVGVGTTNFGLDGTLSLQDGDLLIHNGVHYDLIPGPRSQLNSDWNATVGVTAILNKPNIVNQIIGGTGVSVSPSNGIGTVTINATGTQNLNSVLTNGNTSALGINVGVVSATCYYGSGIKLTGIVTSIIAGTGGITVSGSTGQVTINATPQVNSDWNSNIGIASILNKPTIVNQIIAGSGISIAPSNGIGIVTVTTTYAPIAGIATYATSSGIATYASIAGIATYATTAGIATYASTAGIATYATSSGIATYASIAGIATYASSSGIATYASIAGIATISGYASTSGISSTSQGLTGAPNIVVGVVTAAQLNSNGGGTFADIVTATSYSGSGTNLTGIVTSIVAGVGITISNSTGQVTINGGVGSNILVYALNSAKSLPNAKNTLTSLFGLTNGVGVTSNTRYQYELVFNVQSNKSTGTLSYALALSNGATVAQHNSTYQVNKTTTLGGYAAGIEMASSNAVGAAVTAADTIGSMAQFTHCTMYGTIDVTTAGNINFMISQDQNTPVTWSTLTGSYIKLIPLPGISTHTAVGNWI